jgi:zinc transporter, ZIP family
MLRRLIIMGIIAGTPTIVGAWIGGFLYSPIAIIIFLSIGAGAIFQVVYSVGSWMLRSHNQHQEIKEKKVISVNIFVIGGFAVGMAIMYVTGLLV